MRRISIGPFNRVEGDLEVTLEVEGGRVARARVVSPLYRGFERMLEGRDARDALALVPRICGICSISQSMAAAAALRAFSGARPPANALLASALLHAAENVADHLTHFHLFFMPDFTRDHYSDRWWFGEVRDRFATMKGAAVRPMLRARAELLHITGILAGKWPHTLAIQPGGLTRAPERGDIQRLRLVLHAFRRHAEERLFGAPLEEVAALDGMNALLAFAGERERPRGDFGLFALLAEDLDLYRLGRWNGALMSAGAYEPRPGTHLFAAGVVHPGEARRRPLFPERMEEDASHAWLASAEEGARHPFDGATVPDPDRPGAYTWCKAPRLAGQPVETGALARQAVDGHPLIRAALARAGDMPSVAGRVLARLLEIARLVPAMEDWVRAMRPGEPFMQRPAPAMPDGGRACGLVEAARGTLGHWLRVERGRLRSYQIIAPTTWNFSPRDANGVPGPLEQALEGTPVEADDPASAVLVQHVVRSFDPCMVCTVH